MAPLGKGDVARLKAIFESMGATAKVSSIHVNGWFGAYDKLTMARRFAAEVAGVDIDAERGRWSMRRAPGSAKRSAASSLPTRRRKCGWCRARISWCASSTSTTAAISSRTRTGGIFFAIPYGALPELARKGSWTATAALPGGEFPVDGAAALAPSLRREYPFLDERRAWRLVRHYGAEARTMLGARRLDADCGRDFGGDLTEAEVVHLMDREFARRAEDVVWRRTKSGLRMNAAEIAALDGWMKARRES